MNTSAFSMVSQDDLLSTPSITCNISAGIFINTVSTVHIERLELIGCHLNIFSCGANLQNVNFNATALVVNQTTANFTDNIFENGYGVEYGPLTPHPLIGSVNVKVGGAILVSSSTVWISHSYFENNTAVFGGAVFAGNGSNITVDDCMFTHNIATPVHMSGGGAFGLLSGSSLDIYASSFSHNSAKYGGVIYGNKASVFGNGDRYFENKADFGGVLCMYQGTVLLTEANGSNNEAKIYGGVFYIDDHTHLDVSESTFKQNTAVYGGVITAIMSTFAISNTEFHINRANSSQLLSNVSVIFTGNGGVVFASQSDIVLGEGNMFYNNEAVTGGVVSAYCGNVSRTGSELYTVRITNNSFLSNRATSNGGVLVVVTCDIDIHKTRFQQNTAYGGAIAYSWTSGAIYVDDEINFEKCSTGSECFVQVLFQSISQTLLLSPFKHRLQFSQNRASSGSALYGGLLDRCNLSQLTPLTFGGLNSSSLFFSNISNISGQLQHSITPDLVRVCFCRDGQPDCSYQHPAITNITKGEKFEISVVAVDQVNCSVDAEINSSPNSSGGDLGEGQHKQSVKSGTCSNLSFNMNSPRNTESLLLYADGPCKDSAESQREVLIEFSKCHCSIGFESSNISPTRCDCVCHSTLKPYITNCNSSDNSIRVNTNACMDIL